MPRRKKTAKAQVPVRMVETLRAKLEKSARSRSVSMNGEIVDRLDRSFHNQALVNEVLEAMFGKPLAATLLTIGRAMDYPGRARAFYETGTLEGANAWFDHPGAFDEAVQAATQVLQRLRPSGDPKTTRKGLRTGKGVRHLTDALAVGYANACLDALTGNTATKEEEEWAAPLRDTLGPRVDRARRQRKKGQDK